MYELSGGQRKLEVTLGSIGRGSSDVQKMCTQRHISSGPYLFETSTFSCP